MVPFLSRERFGRPQALAGLLLLVFLGQCLWLVSHSVRRAEVDSGEVMRIAQGLGQWRGKGIAGTSPPSFAGHDLTPTDLEGMPAPARDEFDVHHSPLWYLVGSAPLLVWPGALQADTQAWWGWLARAPYLGFGLVLGASLWYVSRRLFGNEGGFTALGLYCFAPGIIRSSAVWYAQPEIGAAWGAFGAVFTAIAVAHTLYAPREVVLWNWRRIVLLALSLALAIGSQFSLVVVLPLTLGYMLYVAPTRRLAAVAIWLAAVALALVMLLAAYGFHAGVFWHSLGHAQWLGISGKALTMGGAYRQVLAQVGQVSPALALAVPVALLTYAAWPRARYFGNTAPLIVACVFLLLAVAAPHYPGLGLALMAVPFLFVFVAGVVADLLETSWRPVVTACLWGLLGASALWNLLELARVTI
jgi:hypothetical protein